MSILLLAVAISFAPQVVTSSLHESEIMRHVVDECDLYRTYQKNLIDFDPDEPGLAEEAWNFIADRRRYFTDWRVLRDSIRAAVRHEGSFYRRSLMYNAYYQLCIQTIGIGEAERLILNIRTRPLDPNIADADSTVQSLYDPQLSYDPQRIDRDALARRNRERASRDRAKIEVLRFIEAEELNPIVRRKLESVIQEVVYDLELCED